MHSDKAIMAAPNICPCGNNCAASAPLRLENASLHNSESGKHCPFGRDRSGSRRSKIRYLSWQLENSLDVCFVAVHDIVDSEYAVDHVVVPIVARVVDPRRRLARVLRPILVVVVVSKQILFGLEIILATAIGIIRRPVVVDFGGVLVVAPSVIVSVLDHWQFGYHFDFVAALDPVVVSDREEILVKCHPNNFEKCRRQFRRLVVDDARAPRPDPSISIGL